MFHVKHLWRSSDLDLVRGRRGDTRRRVVEVSRETSDLATTMLVFRRRIRQSVRVPALFGMQC